MNELFFNRLICNFKYFFFSRIKQFSYWRVCIHSKPCDFSTCIN